jgi:hypothetical protein
MKSLKISNWQSKVVNRTTDDTMVKEMGQKTSDGAQNTEK